MRPLDSLIRIPEKVRRTGDDRTVPPNPLDVKNEIRPAAFGDDLITSLLDVAVSQVERLSLAKSQW